VALSGLSRFRAATVDEGVEGGKMARQKVPERPARTADVPHRPPTVAASAAAIIAAAASSAARADIGARRLREPRVLSHRQPQQRLDELEPQ